MHSSDYSFRNGQSGKRADELSHRVLISPTFAMSCIMICQAPSKVISPQHPSRRRADNQAIIKRLEELDETDM